MMACCCSYQHKSAFFASACASCCSCFSFRATAKRYCSWSFSLYHSSCLAMACSLSPICCSSSIQTLCCTEATSAFVASRASRCCSSAAAVALCSTSLLISALSLELSCSCAVSITDLCNDC